ncbi:MAG: DUF3500 domain-containing protein [Pseudomonadota bacterium]
MKSAIKTIVVSALGLVVLIGLLGMFVVTGPVRGSQLLWPVVEYFAIEEFVGVTTGGQIRPNLFEISPTQVSIEPVVTAANQFLDSLTQIQREDILFEVDDKEWQRWANIHLSTRQGVGFLDMTQVQAEAAFALIRSGLSARGYQTARDVMRLEGHLADLLDNHTEYGEQRYWLTIMGVPSTTEPWGWQLDGHHLIVNFFVLGDQVVMTPTFVGSEPTWAESGRYAGTRILEEELLTGLQFINSLRPEQRQSAVVNPDKPGNNNRGELFQDNAIVPYEGLPAGDLDAQQREKLIDLIRLYTGNIRPGHAEIRLTEVLKFWDETWFSWVGGTSEEDAFYYRVHSPVVMIEYDQQTPVALDGPQMPSRRHVHTVVRTPNGNDYGKDLLRQHRALQPH